MAKKLRITEKDLTLLIKKIIKEQKRKGMVDYEGRDEKTIKKSSPVALTIVYAKQLAQLADKHSGKMVFDETGIGKLPEFKKLFTKLKEMVNKVKFGMLPS